MAGRPRNSIAFTVVVTVLSVLGALVMILLIALSGAPASLALATALAALPVGPLVACYLWLDRYEPEPRSLLATGLVWGGFVATAGDAADPGRRRARRPALGEHQPDGRSAGRRRGREGLLPAAPAVVASP